MRLVGEGMPPAAPSPVSLRTLSRNAGEGSSAVLRSLSMPCLGVGAGREWRGAGEGVVIEGDAFDDGIDLPSRLQAEPFDRAAGQTRDQRLAGAIEPDVDNRAVR